MHKKISVIGAGGWGTALALLLAENRAQVRLWAHNPSIAEELVSRRTNETYLPGVRLPPNVYATGNLADAYWMPNWPSLSRPRKRSETWQPSLPH